LTWVFQVVEASFVDVIDRVLAWVCQGVEASFVGVLDRVLTWVCQSVDRVLWSFITEVCDG
jgi:hypothetical protein